MIPSGSAVSKRLLVLPFAFLVHDLEELLTVKAWLGSNRDAVPQFLRDRVPTESATLLVAFAVLFAVYTIAVYAVVSGSRKRWVTVVLAVLIMARLTNGIAHLAQVAIFGGYTPGAITAGIIEIPTAAWGVSQLERAELTEKSERVRLFIGGWVLQVIGIAAVTAFAVSIAG